MTYLSFIRAQFPFLFFGFLMLGLSNFGQTFFIALYSGEIRAMFGLSNAGFGGLYSAMTLLSAAVMLFSGRLIDVWALRRFAAFVLLGLAAGCVIMGLGQHILALALALFLLRHFGQGLSSHTGMTATGRAYDDNRGQAISIVQLGYAAFEGFFPLMAVLTIGWVGWQQSWLIFAAVLVFLAVPVQWHLARAEPQAQQPSGHDPENDANRGDVLRDRRFYMLMPLYLAASFLLTGMFFFQVQLAAARGWELTVLASAFALYAFCKVAASLITGAMIDRFTARCLFPLSALPLVLALIVLSSTQSVFGAFTPFVYMALIGVNLGMTGPLSGGLWPELFGTTHLGAIRSLTSPIIIMSTAAAPVLFGLLLDAGVSFTALAYGGIVWSLMASVLAFLALRDRLAADLHGGIND